MTRQGRASVNDFAWVRRSGLVAGAGPGLAWSADFAAAEVLARRGREAEVLRALCDGFGMTLPAGRFAGIARAVRVVWTGPGRWLALWARPRSLPELRDAASISEQSGSRVLLRLTGGDVRRRLASLISLDLHPAVFAVGAAAVTEFGHAPVLFWREADAEGGAVFAMLTPRSFAADHIGLIDEGRPGPETPFGQWG